MLISLKAIVSPFSTSVEKNKKTKNEKTEYMHSSNDQLRKLRQLALRFVLPGTIFAPLCEDDDHDLLKNRKSRQITGRNFDFGKKKTRMLEKQALKKTIVGFTVVQSPSSM